MSYGMKKRGYSLAVPKDKKKVRAMMSEQLKKADPRFSKDRSKSKKIKMAIKSDKKARVEAKVDRLKSGQGYPDLRFDKSRKQHKEYRESIGLEGWKAKDSRRKGRNILKDRGKGKKK